jgi:hypothetical protein
MDHPLHMGIHMGPFSHTAVPRRFIRKSVSRSRKKA